MYDGQHPNIAPTDWYEEDKVQIDYKFENSVSERKARNMSRQGRVYIVSTPTMAAMTVWYKNAGPKETYIHRMATHNLPTKR